MINWGIVRSTSSHLRTLNRRTQFLLAIGALFVLLVAFGIHGSSTGITAGWWMPEKAYTGYLFNVESSPGQQEKLATSELQTLLMNKARYIRWDELAVATPNCLSQLAQSPRFPVINKSIGNGQNMLILPYTPVLHLASLARPASWGFFLLGAQRGLAWLWWFQVLACFIVLFLLFEIVLQGHSRLAAFGAFWFSASAYVICWSQWPAYLTFAAALACLSAYHLLAATRRRVQLASALLLGLALPCFIMFLYPPWQVPVGYFFLLLFLALAIRDKLYVRMKAEMGVRLLLIGVAVVIAAGLTGAWLAACLPDLKVMASTVYPGRRITAGGDYSFGLFFKGLYNLMTIYDAPEGLKNGSEAASFYYLFPAVLFALPFSKRLRQRMGIVGWSLTGFVLAMTTFVLVGIPTRLAKLTLLSYVPSYRADLTIGLASILLCVYVLTLRNRDDEQTENRWEALTPWIAGGAVVVLFILHCLFLAKVTTNFPAPQIALALALLMGTAAYLLIAGKRLAFCALMGALVATTTLFFNPLATNLDHIYDSELAKEISRINKQSSERPFWISYGGVHTGVLVTILGGKSLTGVQWPPQLDIWHTLDPNRTYEANYNRYAEISFEYTPKDNHASFKNPLDGSLEITVSPANPAIKALGVRYVVFMGDVQQNIDTSALTLIYRSSSDNFSIYEIP